MKPMKANDFGKTFLVEECQKISISSFSKLAKEKLKRAFISSEIDAGGQKLELTTSSVHFGGTRYWFKCPMCQKRIGTVFVHPLNASVGCRKCLGLDYRQRRYKGMFEAE